jgi:hypothetical protein
MSRRAMLAAAGLALAPRLVRAQGDQPLAPFRYRASDAELADLRRRLLGVRWPDGETVVAGGGQGVPLAMMQALVEDWRTRYDGAGQRPSWRVGRNSRPRSMD